MKFRLRGKSENEGENDVDHEPDFVREPDKGQETPIQSEDEESDVDQPQPESGNNRTITASPGYLLTRDRTRRIRKPNPKYSYADIIAYALVAYQELADNEPKTFHEAVKSKYARQWRLAMDEEIKSLHENKTWILVPKPAEQKIVDYKWIFKVKEGLSSLESVRFKARLLAKSFTQVEGIDYNEIFSLVVKYTTIRFVLALVTQFNWELEQLDVKTAFLHVILMSKYM